MVMQLMVTQLSDFGKKFSRFFFEFLKFHHCAHFRTKILCLINVLIGGSTRNLSSLVACGFCRFRSLCSPACTYLTRASPCEIMTVFLFTHIFNFARMHTPSHFKCIAWFLSCCHSQVYVSVVLRSILRMRWDDLVNALVHLQGDQRGASFQGELADSRQSYAWHRIA